MLFTFTSCTLATQVEKAEETTPEETTTEETVLLTCPDVDIYLKVSSLTQAQTVYKKLLEDNPNDECALKGLKEIAKRQCNLAQNMLIAGDLEGAKSIYKDVLKDYPDMICAVEGLNAIPTIYDEVKVLTQMCNYDEAWKKLSVAVATNPKDSYLTELTKQPWFYVQKFKEWFKHFIIIIIVLIVGVVVIARIWFCKERLNIGDFELGITGLPDPKKSLIAKFEETLVSLGEKSNVYKPLTLIESPISIPDLPQNLASIPKEVNIVWDFFIKIFPPKVITIKGTLDFDNTKGAGINIKLINSRGNKILSSYTIWQSDMDPGFKKDSKTPDNDDYNKLVDPAACLAYWELYKRKYRKNLSKLTSNLRNDFGTDVGQSFIATRIGSHLLKRLDFAIGEEMMRKALKHDSKNYIAWYNLAVAEYYKASKLINERVPKQKELNLNLIYKNTVRYLQNVIRLTEKDHDNLAHIFSYYGLGTIEIYKYTLTVNTTQQQGDIEKAKVCFEKAIDYAKTAKKKMEQKLPVKQVKSLITDELIILLQIPYTVTQILSDPNITYPTKEINDIEKEKPTNPSIMYSLACFISTMYQFDRIPTEQKEQKLDDAMNYLEDLLAVEKGYVKIAKNDPSLKILLERKQKEFKEILKKLGIQNPSHYL